MTEREVYEATPRSTVNRLKQRGEDSKASLYYSEFANRQLHLLSRIRPRYNSFDNR
jgi:hypothetical protein